jgi:hypothetical protein
MSTSSTTSPPPASEALISSSAALSLPPAPSAPLKSAAAPTATADDDEDTYLDLPLFLSPSFSPYTFANTLITSTNDLSDPQLDLTTPLSRVLFDLQEIDTHIHTLTTSSALPLLSYTESSHTASQKVLEVVEAQVAGLKAAYERLKSEVVIKGQQSAEVLLVVERLHSVTTQLREISRALGVGRQLEVLIAELSKGDKLGEGEQGDYKALIRAAQSIREIREGRVLEGVDEGVLLVKELRQGVFQPAELYVASVARKRVWGFEPVSVAAAQGGGGGGGNGFSVAKGEMKQKAAAGALALYLLGENGEQLKGAVQKAVNEAVIACLNTLTTSLTALTTLDRTVAGVAARCQNLVALQLLLDEIPLPEDSVASGAELDGTVGTEGAVPEGKKSLLDPLLEQLDTTSLPSMFFRSVAAGLEPRIRGVVDRGGANARILKGAKDRVKSALKACVERGLLGMEDSRGVEFEIAVMTGAAGILGR